MKIVLFIVILAFNLNTYAAENNKTNTQFKDGSLIHKELKQSPETTINGPFLLKFKSLTTRDHKTILNTSENPDDLENIIIEMPAFIKNHYIKKFKTDIPTLFLNQNLVVKGKIKLVESALNKDSKTPVKVPTLKLIFTNQLAHYD